MTERARLRRRVPPTVSAPNLLVGGTDGAFRELIGGLVRMAEYLIAVRKGLAKRLGVSGPQFGVLFVIAQLQGDDGVKVSEVAEHLGVTGAFVTTEVGKLARRGLVSKKASVRDRRAVLLRLTDAGHDLIERFAPDLRAINDEIFGSLTHDEFAIMRSVVRRLIEGEIRALDRLGLARRDA